MRLILRLGYLAIPLAFVVHDVLAGHFPPGLRRWEPLITFLLSGYAVVPLAHLMGEATAQLAERTGPTWGGLLNATFGNAAELIIAIIALTKGLNGVVKSSLTGSILGNLLLVSGGAMLVGGWKRERQAFSKATAQTNSALLAVAVVGLLFPAIFDWTFQKADTHLAMHETRVSIGTAIVLLTVYGLGLLFTLRTHRHVFTPTPPQGPEDPVGLSTGESWSVFKSVAALFIASLLTAAVSELLVGSVEPVAQSMGWNPIFVAIILLATFGNAAEHSTALLLAGRNDMDTAMTITYQSSLQIALFVTPFLVLLSAVVSPFAGKVEQLDLIFSPMEVAAVLLSVGVVIVVGLNGETNWFEGVLLLAVYAILGITFFYIPMGHGGGYDKEDAGAARHGRAVEVRRQPQGLMHVTAQ
ncbi:MAG TPA: calcium/proton exchanger [Tepidisphaeraceae bacterium]|nr:calcium/proton exchanger [Tepidisphaeraceae bacterium]